MKVTVPLEMGTLPAVTAAVKVTLWPSIEGFWLETRATEVP